MISVVIPAYNAGQTIEGCVRALQAQTTAEAVEVIVVDDASTDGTGALARAAGARVICEGKLGKSGARNAGARAAQGEILLFTDADCEALPDWVERMIAPLGRDREVVGVKGAYYSRQR